MQHHVATTDPNTVWHKNEVEWGYGGANIGYFLKRHDHTQQAKCATFKFQHSQAEW